MSNVIDIIEKELKDRYEAVHAAITAGPNAGLQELIDTGQAWQLEGAVGRAALGAMTAGVCVAPPELQFDFYGNPVPAYYMLVDEPGSQGSVANAEAFEDLAR
ncbi:MAG: hypothetical protein ACRDTS_16135 [Mycobacterium sp.]